MEQKHSPDYESPSTLLMEIEAEQCFAESVNKTGIHDPFDLDELYEWK